MPGIGRFGDSIGGMNIRAGVSAALYHRRGTGEALEADVSLLSPAWWSAGVGVNTASLSGKVTRNRLPEIGSAPFCPFIGQYKTSDGETISLFTMQPGPHFRSLFTHIGRPDLASDPRFGTAESLTQNWQTVSDHLVEAFAAHPFAYWREHLKTYSGQWTPVQSFLDFASAPPALANDMMLDAEAVDGGAPMHLARGPVQFNLEPSHTTRASQASEHTEVVLMELGVTCDDMEHLKAAGVIA